MSEIRMFTDANEFQRAPYWPHWPEISLQEYTRQKPDLHLVDFDSSGPNARCSIWWRNTPSYENHKVGLFGHYATDSLEASHTVLDEAVKIMKEQGCTLAVGPMDGNIWNKYRLITWSNGRKPFLFEMQHPPEWPAYLTQNGFEPLLHYEARQVTDLDRVRVKTSRFLERIKKKGIVIRNMDMGRAERELEAIYDVSIQCFTDRPFYTQQDKAAFMQQYKAVFPQIYPEFVSLIQDGDRVVGFMFAIPDLMQKMRGEKIDTVMIKTVAVLPDSRYRGIGTMLYDVTHQKAREMGYKTVLHAFIHEDNKIAMDISKTYGSELIRKYSLYAKAL